MRRKDRKITDFHDIATILASCKTCHLALIDDAVPYLVPLSYGWELNDSKLTLYFHSAKEGRKIDILQKNSSLCFNICREGELHGAEIACNYGYYFESITGTGHAEFIVETKEQCRALTLIMQQQSGQHFDFTGEQAQAVCLFKVVSSDFSCKCKKKPK